MKAVRWFLGVVAVLFVLATSAHGAFSQEVSNCVEVVAEDYETEPDLVKALAQNMLCQQGLADFEVRNVIVDGEWAEFVAFKDTEQNAGLPEGFVFGIASKDGGIWTTYLARSKELVELSKEATLPTNLEWMVEQGNPSTRTIVRPFSLDSLPYKLGDASRFNRGPGVEHNPDNSIDFGAVPIGNSNQDLVALFDGSVVFAEYDKRWRKNAAGKEDDNWANDPRRVAQRNENTCIFFRDANSDLIIVYQHLNPDDVLSFASGDLIAKGQFIGRMHPKRSEDDSGCGGESSNPHLHISIYDASTHDSSSSSVVWNKSQNLLNNFLFNGWKLINNDKLSRNGVEVNEDFGAPTSNNLIIHSSPECHPAEASAVSEMHPGDYSAMLFTSLGCLYEYRDWSTKVKAGETYNPEDDEVIRSIYVRHGRVAIFNDGVGHEACTYGSLSNLFKFKYPGTDKRIGGNIDNVRVRRVTSDKTACPVKDVVDPYNGDMPSTGIQGVVYRIVGNEAIPVPNAMVSYREGLRDSGGAIYVSTRTDEKGHYRFYGTPALITVLWAQKETDYGLAEVGYSGESTAIVDIVISDDPLCDIGRSSLTGPICEVPPFPTPGPVVTFPTPTPNCDESAMVVGYFALNYSTANGCVAFGEDGVFTPSAQIKSMKINKSGIDVSLCTTTNGTQPCDEISVSNPDLSFSSGYGAFNSIKIASDKDYGCSTATADGAYVYKEKNEGGSCQFLAIGRHNDLKFQPRSVKLTAGYGAQLCMSNGACHEINGSDSDLADTSVYGNVSYVIVMASLDESDYALSVSLSTGRTGDFIEICYEDQTHYYIDRNYWIDNFGGNYPDQMPCIRTANDDKFNADPVYLTIVPAGPMEVILAVDRRTTALPAGISAKYTKTGEEIDVTDEVGRFDLYRCIHGTGGTIRLPGPRYGGGNGNGSNYIVLLRPANSGSGNCSVDPIPPTPTVSPTPSPTATPVPPTSTPTPVVSQTVFGKLKIGNQPEVTYMTDGQNYGYFYFSGNFQVPAGQGNPTNGVFTFIPGLVPGKLNLATIGRVPAPVLRKVLGTLKIGNQPEVTYMTDGKNYGYFYFSGNFQVPAGQGNPTNGTFTFIPGLIPGKLVINKLGSKVAQAEIEKVEFLLFLPAVKRDMVEIVPLPKEEILPKTDSQVEEDNTIQSDYRLFVPVVER